MNFSVMDLWNPIYIRITSTPLWFITINYAQYYAFLMLLVVASSGSSTSLMGLPRC